MEEFSNWYWDATKSPELKTVKLFNVTHIGYGAFQGCTNLTTLEFGENLESIGNSAFEGCQSLKELIIPDKVTSIGDYAFYGCTSLNTLQLGSGLKSIEENAYGYCTSMLSIISLNTTPPVITETTFRDTSEKNATLYVPSGYKEIYAQAPYWNNFVKIEDGSQEEILEKKNEAEAAYQEAMKVYDNYMSYYQGDGMAFYRQVIDEQEGNRSKSASVVADMEQLENKIYASGLSTDDKDYYLTSLNEMRESVYVLERENNDIFVYNQFYNMVINCYYSLTVYYERLLQYKERIEAATTRDELNALIAEITGDAAETESLYLNPIVGEYEGLKQIEARLIEINEELDNLGIQFQSFSDEVNTVITGITDIIDSETESIVVYTINGIRLGIDKKEDIKTLPNGIYIVNGKKYVVK